VRDVILDRGRIDARAQRRLRPPLFSFRGKVLIAAGLICAAFWAGVGYLIVR
jgi:hypothetical protein